MTPAPQAPIILSFDVEEHHRIEAAAGLTCSPDLRAEYGRRMDCCTRWLLDELAGLDIRATFFVVGQVAKTHPDLVRAMHQAGHEVGSHSWDHRRVHRLAPDEFREDVRRSKEVIEDLTGEAVAGYRAPTFSVTRETAWAIDVLAELGLRYDSSIYPVRHDRYGIPDAPRAPFLAKGRERTLLEIPPATLRLCGVNVPVGGGGYFRLLPLFLMEQAFAQVRRRCDPPVTMLYFHPWEFDPDQPRLPLGRVSRFRTYVGTKTSRGRLRALLRRHCFARAVDVAPGIEQNGGVLPTFPLIDSGGP
ncbi:MAG TPA: XrtA system polysaccharide deacetylase [Gemmataceae bacterium]|nr:XrtA system polysaccharide deacetylase [Gemmataceae bacterium]